jgi:hypothetical protein
LIISHLLPSETRQAVGLNNESTGNLRALGFLSSGLVSRPARSADITEAHSHGGHRAAATNLQNARHQVCAYLR